MARARDGRNLDRSDLMLTDTSFEAGYQTADLAPHALLEPFESDHAIFEEKNWREPKESVGEDDIALSRWSALRGTERTESSITPDHCHVVALALRPARISLWTQSKPLFEGSVSPGTILITTPGQHLRARITPSFDFLHFHVGNRLLREEGLAPDQDNLVPCDALPPFRDTLAEALGRSLLDEHRSRPEYAKVVAKAIVMRAIGRQQVQRRCWELPKWRLKRLEQYLAANIDKRITLDDMAATVGLSKMHFAAQFRVATGFRPHEYLLFKRIEQAKAILTTTRMPLVEVAFSVGFNAQAHFSTVFKRFAGKSPAQWKRECHGLA
jgi:AraC family transcriptional regulator